MKNEIWKLSPGNLAAYTSDKRIMRNIRRSRPTWRIMAEYFQHGKLVGLQYRIPARDRIKAERVFGVKKTEE